MNKVIILQKFAIIDENLNSSARLCLYGSGAFILLDEEDRTSLDLDIAGPYSKVDFSDFTKAAKAADLEINPEETTSKDHIEWISVVRLCLADPSLTESVILWEGKKLDLDIIPTVNKIPPGMIRDVKLPKFERTREM